MKFELNQMVKLVESDEQGTITARSEFTTGEPQYRIRYKAADGRQTESWWGESDIQAL
jgi:hypothetical protein